MGSWPSTLPDRPSSDGFREMEPNNLIMTTMEMGPRKVRRRHTAGVTRYAVSYEITATQRGYLSTFWNTTIKGGSLAFDWVHPITGSTISVRMLEAPVYQPLGTGSVEYVVSFMLEGVPV